MTMSSRRVPGISQLPVHGSTMHDDGENAMEKQWTEQDLHSFVQTAQAVFDSVSLTEEQPEPGWQDESLQVDYELRGGRVDCVLHRIVEADGKRWKLQMSAPLAGNVLPEERMTPRERELCRDDMSHDFLTGVYNRQYLERVFGAKLEQWARQGRSAAVALVALDKGPQLCDTYGQPVMDQLHCFVGNQWKKHYDTPPAPGGVPSDRQHFCGGQRGHHRPAAGGPDAGVVRADAARVHHHNRHDAPGAVHHERRGRRAGRGGGQELARPLRAVRCPPAQGAGFRR